MNNSINIKELKTITSYIVSNNDRLQKEGKKTTAIEVIGESGIGKTSAILQLAAQRRMDVVKLNLAQLEELGDLIGYPLKQFHVCAKDGKCIWIPETLLENYVSLGYTIVEGAESRMSYAPPAWLPKESNSNGGILILDDWNRADQRFIQAVMELLDRGQYISWSLPPNWTICLTANPDNGDYNVSSIDNAQRTRFISFDLAFDKDIWAEWAEIENIDGRCINFVLMYPEILKKEGNVQTINARSLVTFFNTISGIKDFSTAESLYKILLISKGCFSSKEDIVGNLFTMFINNKLDKLIQPDEMLFGKWDQIAKEIEDSVFSGENNSYRADIGATITTRFINFVQNYFNNDEKSDSQIVINRILDIVNFEKTLLAEDLIFNMIRNIVAKYPTRTNKLLQNPKIMKKIIG